VPESNSGMQDQQFLYVAIIGPEQD